MRFVNVWLGLREEAQDAIIERLTFDPELEYTGPVTDREARLFQYMADRAGVQRLFKTTRIAGKDWTIWSMSFTENLSKIQTELDKLLEDRPDHVTLVGAWFWDGRQVGTQFIFDDVTRDVQIDDPDVDPPMVDDPDRLDEDSIPQIVDPEFDWPQITVQKTIREVVGVSGTPTYPIPATALLRFMPDLRDSEGIVTGPATVISDVNLLFGQSPRRFES